MLYTKLNQYCHIVYHVQQIVMVYTPNNMWYRPFCWASAKFGELSIIFIVLGLCLLCAVQAMFYLMDSSISLVSILLQQIFHRSFHMLWSVIHYFGGYSNTVLIILATVSSFKWFLNAEKRYSLWHCVTCILITLPLVKPLNSILSKCEKVITFYKLKGF